MVATITRLPILLLAAAVVTVVAVPQARDTVSGWFSGGGTTVVGEGANRFMVAASASDDLGKCRPASDPVDPDCDDVKFIVIDAARMPFIARNISTAWRAGKPGVLTKDRAAEADNRRKVCRPAFPRKYGGQCDEYPFASTRQGGEGAQEQEVPGRENQCQGGTLSRGYVAAGITDGDDFLVVISHPDKIATEPFRGVDIAIDSSGC